MRIWLVTIGEPLPGIVDEGRLHRTALLSRRLLERGHEVTWWSSTFNHFEKRHRAPNDIRRRLESGLVLRLLHGPGYSRNVCARRLIDHFWIGRKYAAQILREPRPDLILCSFPTIELSAVSVRYGAQFGIPVVLDVRDLWPDIFVDALSDVFQPLGRAVLRPWIAQTRMAFSKCHAIIGISDAYLQWGLRYAQRDQQRGDRVFPLGFEARGEVIPRSEAEVVLRSLGADLSKVLVWFAGTFGATYDLKTIVEACKVIQSRGHRSIQCIISGKGERGEMIRKLASGSDNIVLTGWLGSRELAAVSSLVHVGLAAYAPNAPQGLPNKIFEYMSAGIPIVSSLQTEAKQLIHAHDCGTQYTAGDPQSLADAIIELACDTGRRTTLGKNALRAFAESYSAETIYSRYADYLASAVA